MKSSTSSGEELSGIELGQGGGTAIGHTQLQQDEGEVSAEHVKGHAPLSQRHGVSQDIAWSNVGFVVKKSKKVILRDCYGKVPAGSVCAVMGPSGAGKTSLLNVLAGRSATSAEVEVSGTVTVAGEKIDPQRFRKNIAYVMQDDALLATATPREALFFSASLRLPSSIARETVHSLVEKTIQELGLEDCANVKIGGTMIKGISGGQRKRTSVGVEIITDPLLLFLDEPTSGLDSYNACHLITLLKKIALNNAVVLCTIHQPSSEVFQLFDMCIFMMAGKIFYQGKVAAVVPFFQQFGYQCPANYNPSDYVMNLSQTQTMDQIEASGIMLSNQKDADVVEREVSVAPTHRKVWRRTLSSPLGECMSSRSTSDDSGDKEDPLAQTETKLKSGFGRQLYFLCQRELRNTLRDYSVILNRFRVSVMLNVLFGLIFLNAGNKDDGSAENFNAHFGAVTMVTLSSMVGSAQPVMLSFPFERPLFMREYSTGTYGAIAYFVSKLVLELPITLIQTFFQFIVAYFMVNLNGNFIYIVLAAWGLGVASCSVAVLLGCLLPNVKDVTEMAPLLFVPQLLFAGFFIRTSLIPVFLRWAQYLCAMKYAINLVILTEFDPSLPSCSGDAAKNCRRVIDNNDIVADDWWVYVLLLFVLFAVFRVVAAVVLVKKSQRFY